MIPIGNKIQRESLVLKNTLFLNNAFHFQLKPFCTISEISHEILTKNTLNTDKQSLNDPKKFFSQATLNHADEIKALDKVYREPFPHVLKDNKKANVISKAIAERLNISIEDALSNKNPYGQAFISKPLLSKLDRITILDEEGKLNADLNQLTDKEIQKTFSLPLSRRWEKSTADILHKRIRLIFDRQDEIKYANPQLDHLIQINQGRIDNIDDFDIDQLKYRAEKDLLDECTCQKVYAKWYEIQEKYELSPEDILAEKEEPKKNPYLSISEESLDKTPRGS